MSQISGGKTYPVAADGWVLCVRLEETISCFFIEKCMKCCRDYCGEIQDNCQKSVYFAEFSRKDRDEIFYKICQGKSVDRPEK